MEGGGEGGASFVEGPGLNIGGVVNHVLFYLQSSPLNDLSIDLIIMSLMLV